MSRTKRIARRGRITRQGRIAWSWAAASCVALLSSLAQAQAREVRLAAVVDGPSALYADLGKAFKKEASSLMEGEFSLVVDEDKSVRCDFTKKCVADALDQLLADDSIDLVVGQGFLSSRELLSRKRLGKPALAPFVIDPAAQGLGTAQKRRHLGFSLWSADLAADLRLVSAVADFEKVTLIVDAGSFPELSPALINHLKQQAATQNKQLDTLVLDAEKELSPQLTSDLGLAYVGPLVSWSKDKKTALAAALAEAKVPSFSWLGKTGVEHGFLAASSSGLDVQRLSRLVALNAQALLLGETPEPVVPHGGKRRLILNAQVAGQLGGAVDTSTLLDAVVVGELSATVNSSQDEAPGGVFSLRDAVQWALDHNVSLEQANYAVVQSEQERNAVRSPLLPQLSFGIGGHIIDADRALPQNRQYQAAWSAQAHQTLYDGRSWGSLNAGNHRVRASEEGRRSTKLDVVYQVAAAYIDLLRASTIVQIQKQDLALSQDNLDMARVRQRVGQAGMEEVYRWESRIAQSRRELLAASARGQAARISLNTLLNRPAETRFRPEDLSPDSADLLSSHPEFSSALIQPSRLPALSTALVGEGLERAPELRQLDEQMTAVKREVGAASRSYFIPEVGLDGSFNHRFARGGDGTLDLPPNIGIDALAPDPFDWQVGISARLPIFEGALKSAQVGRGNAVRGQLAAEKRNVELAVEQAVRSSLYQASASYSTITITEDALSAAEGNLRIVTDKYQRGRATIIELLDAQNQSIVAQNQAANAKYAFLFDLMAVERAMGRFDFLVDEVEQKQFIQQLSTAPPSGAPSSAAKSGTQP